MKVVVSKLNVDAVELVNLGPNSYISDFWYEDRGNGRAIINVTLKLCEDEDGGKETPTESIDGRGPVQLALIAPDYRSS